MSVRSPSSRVLLWAGLGILCLAAAVVGTVYYRYSRPKGPPDMLAVYRANNRGIGLMESFEYQKAVGAFEEVVELAPDWIPGKINLGIALLNYTEGAPTDNRAIDLFEEVLKKEPNNPHAHFCLGILLRYRAVGKQAITHFEAVTQIDPTDARSWFELANLTEPDSDRRLEYLERAFRLDPYLSGPIYGLAMELRHRANRRFEAFLLSPYLGGALYGLTKELGRRYINRADSLLAESKALKEAYWENLSKDRYSDMGRYAEVIGEDPNHLPAIHTGPLPIFLPFDKFQVKLSPGARWATNADLKREKYGELRVTVRERFGATMVVLDYNRDGNPDLFLLGAVIENGQVRDLLLRNEGDGRFTDVTAEAGLSGSRPSLGCCVGDFDNNEFPDLFITGIGQQWLFRNNGKGEFDDVTAEAGLDKLTSVCLGSAFVDLDQDGDLDLLIAQYAATPEEALALLTGRSKADSTGGLAVFLNIGVSTAVGKSQDPPPLNPRFRRAEGPPALLGQRGPTVGMALSDVDDDHDLDLILLEDEAPPAIILNDRLLRFHREKQAQGLAAAGRWNGVLVLDANHDGHSDLFFIRPGQAPLFLLSQRVKDPKTVVDRFKIGTMNSPPLIQAQAIDLDYDGWTDIVGLSDKRLPVLLQNDGERLVHRQEALGLDADWSKDLLAVSVGRFAGERDLDLMVWSESSGIHLYRNQGNGNNALKLELTGHRKISASGEPERSNADGFGVWAWAQVEGFWTGAEYTTLSAGLGQSRQPLILGIGHHPQPDVVRLRWPDNVPQAELNIPACRVTRIDETNRKPTSCPILFTWNGERFVFVTDFLGAGSIGELQPDGTTRPPRAEESVKIEAEQLAERDGKYLIKLAEPMDEATYLDRLQLVVLDHPADVRVYPDERFSEESPTTQELLAFRQEIFPVQARDHHGRDVTRTLAKWDRDTVDGFARRSWLGFAEEHWVELDFGDRLAKFSPSDRLILCLAGWTEYPYPESIWAANQAGVAMLPPILERVGDDGQWHTLVKDAGFPAGLPKMMTREVTGKLSGPRCVLRLRTNLDIYWDQIFVAPLVEKGFRANFLEVHSANLSPCGLMQEFSPDGRQPTIYDYYRTQSAPVARLTGRMTRFGDVTELLRERDDRFVIFGPGDELTVEFDAKSLPELPPGWKRSFVLRTWGYCKDCAPFTATGDTIEPLPFQKMSQYPYGRWRHYPKDPLHPARSQAEPGNEGGGPGEHYPKDALHEDYLRRYNTRQVGPARARGR